MPPAPQLHGQHLCVICLDWTAWTQCTGPRSKRHIFHCRGCKPFAPEYADMSDRDRKKMRCEAVYAASEKIGAYLDGKGKTDFAKMSENEWYDFLHKVLDEYGVAVRDITRKFH